MLGFSLVLSACSNEEGGISQETTPQGQIEQTGGTGAEGENIITTNSRISDEFYRPVLVDGEYKPSNTRGITLRMNSSVNLKAFETGLMRHSQEHFSTDNHLFQEGQLIPSDQVTGWLERKSESNPDGLNPEDNGEKEPDTRNPRFLETILEQNYYKETDNGLELAGISIGLGMNKVDYYRKVEFGAQFETNITREELLEQGRQMANEIVSRIRELENGGTVPIMVAIFEQAPRDNMAGGVFISKGMSESGAGSVAEWTTVNERKEVFPLTGTDSNEGTSFQNFKSEIELFFPNLSGVTGIAHYKNDQLMKLDVNIVTQFYGAGEMVAFTHYVKDAAGKFLPPEIAIEITVESMDGVEAFLLRQSGQETFDAHLFSR